MSVRLFHLFSDELAPYQAGLARLEAEIRYPIADGADHFRIDHGARYAAFFERMGDAHFLMALDGDQVVGIFSGINRFAESGGRRVRTQYGADYKIAPAYRGGKLSRRYLLTALAMAFRPATPSWRIVYVAAMRGTRGDVMRAARGITPMRLGRPAARLAVYFTEPRLLAKLEPAGAPPVVEGGLDLSPDALHDAPGVTSTAGCKDLRLESTGRPWPLTHLPLGPRAWRPNLGAYLRACGESIGDAQTTACFALDERLVDQIGWLAANGIRAGASCTVYLLRWPFAPRPAPWVHLATSEI